MKHVYPDWIDEARLRTDGPHCGLCGNIQRYESFLRVTPDKQIGGHRIGNPNVGLRLGLRQSHASQCPLFPQNGEMRALPTSSASPVGKYE